MKLSQLREDFLEMSETRQMEFFAEYLKKRAADMLKPPTYGNKKKKASGGTRAKKGKKVTVTQEEYDVLKKLGLI